MAHYSDRTPANLSHKELAGAEDTILSSSPTLTDLVRLLHS